MVDGKIRIWSTDAIYKSVPLDLPKSKKKAPLPPQPDQRGQLCAMSTHTGAVTVLRFSPCGRYLASGSDDRVVLIWEKDESRIPHQEFGSQGEVNLETWVARKRLIGHENDVQDLAWAPDSSILVTVGLDSSIIIWNGTTFEKLKTFDAHQSLIKGVTFDPANKYFATASDDRTVRIIRYHHTSATDITFSIESTVSTPFKDSPLSTYYRRCSWSPDGNHIAVANATNGPVTTVSIINRGTWDSDISLIGHDAPCEVASFCPRIFSQQKKPVGKDNLGPTSNLITVIATAGQDKTLAIWNTSHPRPLLVALNAAEKAITDIAWSPDGNKLFACSLDGTILVALFDEGELGWVIPMEENENQLTRYGGGKETMQIPSSTGQLILEEKAETMEDFQKVKRMDEIMGFNATTSNGFDSRISGQPNRSKTFERPLAKPSTRKNHTLKPPAQKITITKDGKKRVAPMLLTSVSSEVNIQPVKAEKQRLNEKFDSIEVSNASVELPPGGMASRVIQTCRPKPLDGFVVDQERNKKLRYDNESYYKRPAVLSFASDISPVQLSVPKVKINLKKMGAENRENFILEIRNGVNRDLEPTKILVTSNGTAIFVDFLPSHGHLAAGEGDYFWAVATEDGTIYTYSPTGKRLFPGIVLGAPISYLESQDQYLMAVTSTGMVHAWNICNSTAVHEAVSISPLLDSALSSAEEGVFFRPKITLCGITSKGKAVITLNNGDGYMYSKEVKSWLRISELCWALGSHYWNSAPTERTYEDLLDQPGDEITIPTVKLSRGSDVINVTEQQTNIEALSKAGDRGKYLQEMMKNRMLKEGFENFESFTSTAHLENRVSAAIMAESGLEFQRFLKMYAVRLASEGMEKRLEEVCYELLGPIKELDEVRFDSLAVKKWSQTICGVDKHGMLRDVLSAIEKYKQVQDISARFSAIVSRDISIYS